MAAHRATRESAGPEISCYNDSYVNDIRLKLKAYFEQHAQERDRWKSRSRYYHERISHLVRGLIPAGQKVAEIGCGTGDLLSALSPSGGMGIDFSHRMIEIARSKYPALQFTVDDLEQLGSQEPCDYVVLSDVLGSLADVWLGLRQLHKLCHPGTRVIITHYNYLWEPLLRMSEALGLKARQPLQHWLPLADIENLMALNGFRVVRKGYSMLLPIWLPGLSYLVNRFLAPIPGLRRLCLVQYLVARPELPRPQAPKPEPSVSIVVPCLDEEGHILPLVERLPRLGAFTEVVFVDGGSTDGTVQKIERVLSEGREGFRFKLIHQGGRFGKGDAVRKGFAACSGEILMILDADLSVAPEDLPKFYLALIESRGELINGSRLNYPMEDEAMRYLNNMGNKLFGMALSWLIDRHVRDTLCGTKALSREHYERIKTQRDYFGEFDPFGDFDLLFGAARLGLEIVDMPVRYRSRAYGATKISRFKHGALLARMCLVAMRKLKFA
ncbi:MAG: glycosyltransferase [Elusimicrobia bacterium]|nr:glycosyltransferase [Elusimicrobiota bacterium]